MEKELLEFFEFAKACREYRLPEFDKLPRVPLYMEQVVGYINDVIGPYGGSGKNLTPFMVNNYVKAKIIKEPDGKKYHEEHLGYLIFISLLKDTLSMEQLGTLIDLDDGVSKDKSKLYAFFSDMEMELNRTVLDRLVARLEDFYGRYKRNKKWPYTRSAEKDLRNSIGLMALRLSVQASINARYADMLLDAIGKDMYGEAGYKVAKLPSKKETKRRGKIELAEAGRLAVAKDLAIKKEREEEEKAKKEMENKKQGKKKANSKKEAGK